MIISLFCVDVDSKSRTVKTKTINSAPKVGKVTQRAQRSSKGTKIKVKNFYV